MIAIKLIY